MLDFVVIARQAFKVEPKPNVPLKNLTTFED